MKKLTRLQFLSEMKMATELAVEQGLVTKRNKPWSRTNVMLVALYLKMHKIDLMLTEIIRGTNVK